MVLLCSIFFTLVTSAVDAYTMGKEISEMMRFQHQSGGFYDSTRDANARDTLRAIWIASVYGAFGYIDGRGAYRWFQTLRNRDGGAALIPGSKSTVYATYCYTHAASLFASEPIDQMRTIEFLKSCYDSSSGLFRDTPEAEPTIEATYYAYELLSRFRDSDLSWLQSYSIQTYINDHLNEDHFEFDDVSVMKAQLWAGSIAKSISLTVPYHRISEFIVNKVNQLIKENKLDNEDAAAAALILKNFGDETIPEAIVSSYKLGGSLADLYYINQIIVATGEVSKFFDVKVLALTTDNHVIDFEKDGLTIQQVVRPAVTIQSLGRFINPMLRVNITTHMGDEQPYSESLNIDPQNGLFHSQRISSVSKLGTMQIDVVAWFVSELSSPIFITKAATSRVSLPVDIQCDAWLQADELIQVNEEIQPGTNFKVTISGKLEDIELQESTAVTFQVTDPSGAILYHKFEDFKGQTEFNWQLPSLALPAGDLHATVEIGDSVNHIHTRKEFTYKISNDMAATKVEVPSNLKLSEVIHVKMFPALHVEDNYVEFTNEKVIDGELKDASGEIIYPQSSSETHHYSMRVKVGGIVVKTIDGEVQVTEDNKLYVDFETNVNENLDFATGFSVDFLFNTEGGLPIELSLEHEIFVKVQSKIIAEGDALKSGNVEYGSKIKTEFRLKDEICGKYLEAGRAYPVIAILSATSRKVLLEEKTKTEDDKYTGLIQISAAVESGAAIVAVMIRKGEELVPVTTTSGSNFESKITVTGTVEISAKVVEARKFVIVDFATTYKGKNLRGTAFLCRIKNSEGAVVAELPLAQMEQGSRLSWESEEAKGEHTIQLFRLNSPEGKPLFEKSITVESSLLSVIHHLPVEGLTLAVAFILFVWSIRVRKGIQSTR